MTISKRERTANSESDWNSPKLVYAISKLSVDMESRYKDTTPDNTESQPKEIDDNKERYPSPCDTIEKIKKGEVDNPSTSSQTSISTPAKKRKIKDSDKIPLQKKLALAIGAAPLALPLVTATVFITLFLLDVVLLEPKYSSLVLLLGRSFDAVSDPLVGFLVNKTQRKGNTLKYWMGFAIPFLLLAYFMLWVVPMKNGENQIGILCYYLSIYILLQIAFTIYGVPYAALIMFQTNDQRERDIATAFRMTAEIVFAILGIGVVGGIVSDTLDSDSVCDDSGDVNDDWLKKAERKYMIAGGAICALVLFSGLVTFLGTNERSDITIPSSKISTAKATKRVLKHTPYIYLMASYFCMYLSVTITQGNLQLYFKYHLDKVDHFTYAMVVLLVCIGVGIPVWQAVMLKLGKKSTAYIGVLILIPCYAVLGAVPSDTSVVIVYATCAVAGFAIGSAYLIPWSMLPDVIDNYTVENSERNESIFFGFFVFFNKFAAGAGLGVSLAVLEIAGYDNEACEQPDAVQNALRLLCSPGPAALVLLYAFFVFMYPITDKKCKENKEVLKQRILRERYGADFHRYVNRSFEFDNEAIETF